MAAKIQPCEMIRSLRRFKDRRIRHGGHETAAVDTGHGGHETAAVDTGHGRLGQSGCLDYLPVDVQFLIMTFLSPADICCLGATSRYWRGMVRDPLLWRFFLLRDMPHWASIDHLTMPQLELLDSPLVHEDESLDDRDEWEAKRSPKLDYMAEYTRGCPSRRQQWLPSKAPFGIVTSFFQSLVPSCEPRYAMFGPGMEQLNVSLVTRIMHAPHLLPVSVTSHRQINGIGSGISYRFNSQQKFNILTLYSTNRAERERARVEKRSISNKLFNLEGADECGRPVYSPAPHVHQVCQVVDGFIYVANAEHDRDELESEAAQIRAMLNPAWGSASRPLLVFSCVSREEGEVVATHGLRSGATRNRVPCVHMAKRLDLPQLTNPWMVQDVVAESLSGLLDGISWLLRCSGVKVHGR